MEDDYNCSILEKQPTLWSGVELPFSLHVQYYGIQCSLILRFNQYLIIQFHIILIDFEPIFPSLTNSRLKHPCTTVFLADDVRSCKTELAVDFDDTSRRQIDVFASSSQMSSRETCYETTNKWIIQYCMDH